MFIWWRGACLFGCFACQLRNALIWSPSPVSRVSSSSYYISFSPSVLSGPTLSNLSENPDNILSGRGRYSLPGVTGLPRGLPTYAMQNFDHPQAQTQLLKFHGFTKFLLHKAAKRERARVPPQRSAVRMQSPRS